MDAAIALCPPRPRAGGGRRIDERTYTNPVCDGYLGDPFVLKHRGVYYAYGTVPLGELTVPVLRSFDLVNWRPLGAALAVRDEAFEALWAPEVAYDNGSFFMYYSAGAVEGQGHRLRVATATDPAGPFEEYGVVLTPDEPFTIDAHPFRDDDGQWYLFYCRDFLDPDTRGRVGTGIVVDRLAGMTRLAGEPRTVVRPHAEWHLYERRRSWYGRIWDWYTVEGPFVRKHGGRYYCFYSGGAWKEPNYGVSYVVAESPTGPFVPGPDEEGPEILRTRPGRAIGPGHASLVHAPDNVHEYIVYHAWDTKLTSRQMRIDPLLWGEGGPSSPGPTLDPQPAPPLPLFFDGFGGPDGAPPNPASWQIGGGDWRQGDGELVQHDLAARAATALLREIPPNGTYLLEVNTRLISPVHEGGRYGLCLGHGTQGRAYLALEADGSALLWIRDSPAERSYSRSEAPVPGFRSEAYHRLQLSVRGGRAEAWLDGVRVASRFEVPAGGVGLFTWGVSAAFDGVSVTALPDVR